MKKLSAALSFCMALALVSLYVSTRTVPLGFEVLFRILPDSDIYLSNREIEGTVVSFIAAFAGLGLFFLATRKPEKKIINGILYTISALLIIGFQIVKGLHGFHVWDYKWEYYWDELLKALMLDALPFIFILLGFLVLKGWAKANILLAVLFGCIGAYHLFLIIQFTKVFGRAFSSISRDDLVVAIVITSVSLACIWVNVIAYRRSNTPPST